MKKSVEVSAHLRAMAYHTKALAELLPEHRDAFKATVSSIIKMNDAVVEPLKKRVTH